MEYVALTFDSYAKHTIYICVYACMYVYVYIYTYITCQPQPHPQNDWASTHFGLS